MRGRTIVTDMATGFCFAARASLMRSVGGFDDSFRYGLFEDFDLARRIRREHDIVVDAAVYAHHGGPKGASQSLLQRRGKAAYYMIANGLQYARKWRDYHGTVRYLLRGAYRGITGHLTVSDLFGE